MRLGYSDLVPADCGNMWMSVVVSFVTDVPTSTYDASDYCAGIKLSRLNTCITEEVKANARHKIREMQAKVASGEIIPRGESGIWMEDSEGNDKPDWLVIYAGRHIDPTTGKMWHDGFNVRNNRWISASANYCL